MAYLNHDIDDSIRAGLLIKEQLPKDIVEVLGDSSTQRLDTLIKDFVKTSNDNINNGIKEVGLSKEINEAMIELRKFMFKNIYLGDTLKVERNKAKFILKQLIEYFEENPEQMPEMYLIIAKNESLQRAVADYIAGMSDDYCLLLFNKIFIPKVAID
jgi:dGTPase